MMELPCPYCEGVITASVDLAGNRIPCPKCGADLLIPVPEDIPSASSRPEDKSAPEAEEAASPPSQPSHKLCRYCAESIAFAAIKCKHCGEFLDERTNSSLGRGVQTTEATGKAWKAGMFAGTICMLFGLLLLESSLEAGLATLFIGFVITSAARLGAWWYHD